MAEATAPNAESVSPDASTTPDASTSVPAAPQPATVALATPQTVTIARNHKNLNAWLFSASAPGVAEDEKAVVPAILLVHDRNGLDDFVTRTATRLSNLGYVVIAPDFFAAHGGPEGDDEKARQGFIDGLSDSAIVQDILDTLNWLTGHGEVVGSRLGIVGWGWGGAYALMGAAHDSRLQAAVDVGGTLTYAVSTPNRPGSPLNYVADLDGALLAAFSGHDPQFPEIEVERLRVRLQEHDKRGEVKIYDAPSRFWEDGRSPHTQALWRRIESFLETNLLETDADAQFEDAGYPNEESRIHA